MLERLPLGDHVGFLLDPVEVQLEVPQKEFTFHRARRIERNTRHKRQARGASPIACGYLAVPETVCVNPAALSLALYL